MRKLLIPAKRAASALAPRRYTRRPKLVQLSRNATAAARAANTSTGAGAGTPSSAPLPSTLIASANPSTAAPTLSNAATPTAIAGAAPGACGSGATLRIAISASIEERLARPITDRSIPPVSIDTITANPRSANSGNWNAIDEKFARAKNSAGCAALIPANTSVALRGR